MARLGLGLNTIGTTAGEARGTGGMVWLSGGALRRWRHHRLHERISRFIPHQLLT
jgi:hypothetical protein